MEFENRTFETEYRSNYVRLKPQPTIKYSGKQEFKDPISESFKNYLTTDEACEEENTENYDVFVKRYGKEHPKIAEKYFKEPFNADLMNKLKDSEKKTVYQQNFCSFDGHEKYMKPKETHTVSLPKDWVEGTTTHKWSYRDPVILFPKIYKNRVSPIRPICEMNDAHKHSIMRKNVSEFAGTIGELGTFILENELHGPIQKIDL